MHGVHVFAFGEPTQLPRKWPHTRWPWGGSRCWGAVPGEGRLPQKPVQNGFFYKTTGRTSDDKSSQLTSLAVNFKWCEQQSLFCKWSYILPRCPFSAPPAQCHTSSTHRGAFCRSKGEFWLYSFLGDAIGDQKLHMLGFEANCTKC